MPKQGFKAVTVRDELYEKLQELSENEERTISIIVSRAVKAYYEKSMTDA